MMTTTTVKLDASKYLDNGELTGIGIGIFGGPEWNDAAGDRHTVTISNVKLEGEQSAIYDLNQSVVTSGTNGTGYTDANGWGSATIGDSIVITGGIRYDAHKISLVEKEESGETEPDTYVVLDVQIDILGGNWTNDIEIRFYPYNFQGNPHETYTDIVILQAGERQTVKLDASKYLVNGELTGIGIGIFGGPEWNDAAGRKHTVTISNVKLEGKQSKAFDLNKSVVTSGTNGTGYTTANAWGSATIGDSIVITGGIRYDAHKITLG